MTQVVAMQAMERDHLTDDDATKYRVSQFTAAASNVLTDGTSYIWQVMVNATILSQRTQWYPV